MRKPIALTLLAALSANVYAFTPADQALEPAPVGHVVGKDNFVTESSHRFHFAGEDCGICHAPGRKAEAQLFSMAGTIYTDRTGRKPLQGAEIILKDSAGNVISMTSNEAGNFFTKAPVASDPQAWNSAKTDAENLADPATWRYKTWVKKGDYELPMVTIAGVGGSATTQRMGCGMHHAPQGSRGALNVAGKSTLPAYPSTGLSYKQHIQPILKNSCKSCHLPYTAAPSTTYPTGSTPYVYSGRLDLSSYTPRAAGDKGIAGVVNTANPDESALLAKVKFGSSHAGGAFLMTTDPDYQAMRQWIIEGAEDN